MSNFILLQDRLYMEGSKNISIPSLSMKGFEDSGFIKVLQSPFFVAASLLPVMPIVKVPIALIGATSGVIKNMTGAGDVDQERLSHALDEINFYLNEKPSAITSTFDVTALKRNNSSVDIVIKAHITYTPGYRTKVDSSEMRSCYQDMVRFDISPNPDEINLWNIGQDTVVPKTNNNEVSYSITTGWSASAGLSVSPKEGPSANTSVNYSFQTTSTTTTNDFNIQRETISPKKYISWSSSMKNCYEANNGSPYDIQNPYGLVNNSPFTRWLKAVPDVARADFSLEYQSTYSITPEKSQSIFGKVVSFDVIMIQRLIHAEVVGRTGQSWARIGGNAVVYPSYLVMKGRIYLDFANSQVHIEPMGIVIHELRDIINHESEINNLLHNVVL